MQIKGKLQDSKFFSHGRLPSKVIKRINREGLWSFELKIPQMLVEGIMNNVWIEVVVGYGKKKLEDSQVILIKGR